MESVVITRQFAGKSIYEMSKGQGQTELVNKIAGKYPNEESGKTFELSATNIRHAISSATNNQVDQDASFEIVAALPKLIRTAKLGRTHHDRKHEQGVKEVHRYYAGARIGNDTYTVQLTVKEIEGKAEAEVENIESVGSSKLLTVAHGEL
jgi:hypothetical protein